MQFILLMLTAIILLSGCAPTFPVHALKKGEWGGNLSATIGKASSLSGSVGYGVTNEATAYLTASNLLNGRLGMYFAITHSNGYTPELGIDGFSMIGGYSWSEGDKHVSTHNMDFFPETQGIFCGGLALHSVWKIDSSGSLLYAVATNYFQPGVGYALRPSIGAVLSAIPGGTAFQIDIQAPFFSQVTDVGWQPVKSHFAVSIGLVF